MNFLSSGVVSLLRFTLVSLLRNQVVSFNRGRWSVCSGIGGQFTPFFPQAGKQLFLDVGCGKCHTPELQTGPSAISALSNKTFFPYTDLLLHDMGPGLDDGYTEGSALTSEWRTPALWGLGLSKNSQGGQYFLMHDGRARTITEAISLHGGEGQKSKDKFQVLSSDEKVKLIKFLESL